MIINNVFNFVVLGTPIDVLDASKIAPVPVSEVTVNTVIFLYPFPEIENGLYQAVLDVVS